MTEVHLGPHTQAWKCLECGAEFAWHPGTSGLTRPSMCGSCSQEDQFKLVRLAPTADGKESQS